MILKYILYSISITLGSWTVGMIFCSMIKKQEFYNSLSNLNLIKSETLNNSIGLGAFKWIVKNTFFKYFNQKLRLKNKIGIIELTELRKEMTFAEISHLIAFGLVTIFAVVKFIYGNHLFGLTIIIMNIVLNLYPSLLQQANKRRIDKFIKKVQLV